jgi:hypothetical protein
VTPQRTVVVFDMDHANTGRWVTVLAYFAALWPHFTAALLSEMLARLKKTPVGWSFFSFHKG